MATDSNRPSGKTTDGTSARSKAKEVAQEAGTTAKEVGREAVDQAKSTTEYVRQQARTSVEEGKNQVAEQVGGLAKAFHRSSEELRNDDLGRLAEQSEWLAGRVEELQRYLQERDASELLNDMRGVARSKPAWFLGGLFAAGLVTARFLHSGQHDGGRNGSSQGSASRNPYQGSRSYGSDPSDAYRTADTIRP